MADPKEKENENAAHENTVPGCRVSIKTIGSKQAIKTKQNDGAYPAAICTVIAARL